MSHVTARLLLLCSLPFLALGCGEETQPTSWTGQSTGDDRDWATWGSSGHVAYAMTVDEALLVYGWDGATVRLLHDVALAHDAPHDALWCGDGVALTVPVGRPPRELLVREAGNSAVVARLPVPDGWWCARTGPSADGMKVALALQEDLTRPPVGHNWDRPRLRIGVLDVRTRKLTFPVDLVGDFAVRRIVPSCDGAYVAVAGWKNGAAVIDAAHNRALWEARPPGETNAGYLALCAPKGVVYVGGWQGRVYGMDLKTGAIKSCWPAARPGETRCESITALAASADGEFVAAGTGPEGRTYVWRADSGRLVKVFGTGRGGVLIAMFSPYSEHLAVLQPGRVEVVSMPEE